MRSRQSPTGQLNLDSPSARLYTDGPGSCWVNQQKQPSHGSTWGDAYLTRCKSSSLHFVRNRKGVTGSKVKVQPVWHHHISFKSEVKGPWHWNNAKLSPEDAKNIRELSDLRTAVVLGGLGTSNLGLVTSRFGLEYLLSKPFVNLQGIFWTLVITVLLAYH